MSTLTTKSKTVSAKAKAKKSLLDMDYSQIANHPDLRNFIAILKTKSELADRTGGRATTSLLNGLARKLPNFEAVYHDWGTLKHLKDKNSELKVSRWIVKFHDASDERLLELLKRNEVTDEYQIYAMYYWNLLKLSADKPIKLEYKYPDLKKPSSKSSIGAYSKYWRDSKLVTLATNGEGFNVEDIAKNRG